MFPRVRSLLVLAVCLLGLSAIIQPAFAGAMRRHALSLIGTPKYGPDFTHFAYVNPGAPKGGTVRMSAIGSFDSLNPFILFGANGTGGFVRRASSKEDINL